jgi:hypothetical protein
MNHQDLFLGIVQNRQFHPLGSKFPLGSSIRLTHIQMQTAMSPESGELDLTQYEGSAIMVQGHSGGGWIYTAQIIDKAGPILTAVVKRVFGPHSQVK